MAEAMERMAENDEIEVHRTQAAAEHEEEPGDKSH
jgi:hypothetical protein